MGAIVIWTRFDEGTKSAEVATSVTFGCFVPMIFFKANSIHSSIVAILEPIRGAQCLIAVIRSSGEEM
jgi:hypothetical protein